MPFLEDVLKITPSAGWNWVSFIRSQVAVALGTAVYLWNAGTGVIEELCATTEEDDYITSLAWAADGAPKDCNLASSASLSCRGAASCACLGNACKGYVRV